MPPINNLATKQRILNNLQGKTKVAYKEFLAIQAQCDKAIEAKNAKKAKNLIKQIARISAKIIKTGKHNNPGHTVFMGAMREYRNHVTQKLSEM